MPIEKVNDYFYDKNGNQVSRLTAVYNGQAEGEAGVFIDEGGDFELNTFDAFNRLVATQTSEHMIEYAYKVDGLRVSKTVDGNQTIHVWDGQNMVLETGGNGQIKDVYTRGLNLIKSNENGYYVYNSHGDVVSIVNSSGVIAKTYGYDVFGVELTKMM